MKTTLTLYQVISRMDWCKQCKHDKRNGGKCPGDPAHKRGVDCAVYRSIKAGK